MVFARLAKILQRMFPGTTLLWIFAAFLVGVSCLAFSGNTSLGAQSLIAALSRILELFAFPFLYFLSAHGWGTLASRILLQHTEEHRLDWNKTHNFGLGLSIQLTLSHAMGCFGLFSHSEHWWKPLLIAALTLVPGIVLYIWFQVRLRRVCEQGREFQGPWFMRLDTIANRVCGLLSVVLIGLLFAASVSTPGFLWSSEFGGFDALSYHLQLPQEWIATGRVTPLDNNVYSYLPSYLEVAFTHIALLVPGTGSAQMPMLSDGGSQMLAAQMSHAFLTMYAAFNCGNTAFTIARRWGYSYIDPPLAAWITTLVCLATPWTLVVGSLAYNEMGVVLLFACATSIALDDTIPDWRRTVACAILVGVACGIKPTALLFVGPPIGVMLLCTFSSTNRVRSICLCTVLGILAGLLTLSPWMIRNTNASGNPVFPFAASIFVKPDGSMGHWNAEQISRYSKAHHFEGSVTDRLKLTVLPDLKDPVRPTHRGLVHPQWGITALGGMCVAFGLFAWLLRLPKHPFNSNLQRVFVSLCACLIAQITLWLFTTHIQSRFLLPCIVPLALAWGLGISITAARWKILATAAPICIVALNAFLAVPQMGFSNLGLVFMPSLRAGTHPELKTLPDKDKSSEQFINTSLTDTDRVVLLGDTAPLYYIPSRVAYATTWDRNPFTAAPLEGTTLCPPDQWSAKLKSAGFTHILINFAELDRFHRSGFLDPAINIEQIAAWARTQSVVREWQQTGQVLIKLR